MIWWVKSDRELLEQQLYLICTIVIYNKYWDIPFSKMKIHKVIVYIQKSNSKIWKWCLTLNNTFQRSWKRYCIIVNIYFFSLFQIGTLKDHYVFSHKSVIEQSEEKAHHHHQKLATHPKVSSYWLFGVFRW